MKAQVLVIALMLSLAFTAHAAASSMMGMSIPEFFAWGWRIR